MFRRSAVAVAGILLSPALALADAAHTTYGSTVGGPTMNVPSSLVTLSGVVAPYSVQPVYLAPAFTSATCDILGLQTGYDGVLALYQGFFNPASPLTNLIAFNDDSTSTRQSLIENVTMNWASNFYLVSSGYNGQSGVFNNHIRCDSPATGIIVADGGLPSYDGRYLELLNGRFLVWAEWENFFDVEGDAYGVPMGSSDSALLWFFQPQNWEVLIKVIDGCGLNDRYWVFAAATTNVEYTLFVQDVTRPVSSSNPKVYFNPKGNISDAIVDTSAFATCP